MPTAVGIPKEIKDQEGRVSMQPDAVVELVHHGHEILAQSGASKGSGFSDEEYESAGGAWSRAPTRSSRLRT
jgi:alanine dehydrogenase